MNDSLRTWLESAWTWLAGLLLLFLGGCLMAGCSVTTANSGDWMLTFGSQIGFKTSAAQTSQQPAEVTIDFASLENLIDSWSKDEEETPAPAPAPAPAPK